MSTWWMWWTLGTCLAQQPLVLPAQAGFAHVADLDGVPGDELVTLDPSGTVVRIYSEGPDGLVLRYTWDNEIRAAPVRSVEVSPGVRVLAWRNIPGGRLHLLQWTGETWEHRSLAAGTVGGGLRSGDTDDDGRVEWIAGDGRVPSAVFRFEWADGDWVPLAPLVGQGGDLDVVAPADVDCDGRTELVFTDDHYYEGVNRLYVYQGDVLERTEPHLQGSPLYVFPCEGGRAPVMMRDAGRTELRDGLFGSTLVALPTGCRWTPLDPTWVLCPTDPGETALAAHGLRVMVAPPRLAGGTVNWRGGLIGHSTGRAAQPYRLLVPAELP